MELRQLRYFRAVVHAGTVSRAAAELHMAQPGLSRQVQGLERELGVELFDRVGGRLHLTRAGCALMPLVEELLDRAESLRVAAAFHSGGRLETLSIGAPTVTLTDVVAPFVASLGQGEPTTDIFTGDGLDPVEVLHAGADLAIGTVRPPAPYRSAPLAVLPVWAYVPEGHPWAESAEICVGELVEETLIVLPSSYTARIALDAAVTQDGLSYPTRIRAANGTVAQALAAAGRGVAVVSDDPRFDLCPVRIGTASGSLAVRLVAVWDGRHPGSAVIADFAHRLGTFVRERYAAPAE
ncbi:MAG: LysR family transcriptional regulator [Nocardioidaceae bacterium]|nr:LysR family transcriptional regulator [Nocardioidaceae bacterium]